MFELGRFRKNDSCEAHPRRLKENASRGNEPEPNNDSFIGAQSAPPTKGITDRSTSFPTPNLSTLLSA